MCVCSDCTRIKRPQLKRWLRDGQIPSMDPSLNKRFTVSHERPENGWLREGGGETSAPG